LINAEKKRRVGFVSAHAFRHAARVHAGRAFRRCDPQRERLKAQSSSVVVGIA